MKKQILNTRGFRSSRILAVLAVVMLIALLLMIEKVAMAVVNAGNSVGINMPPVPIFRQAAGDIFMVAAGAILVMFSWIVMVPVAKFAIIAGGLALAGYGLYQIYKLIVGKPVQDILPKK